MKISYSMVLALAALIFLMPETARLDSESGDSPARQPLAGFERLIGGQWHLEGSYQEFEWGAGQRSVKARSYFLIEGEPKLVSEGIWFWHPDEREVKGVFTAVDMPMELFEYTTRFKGDSIVSNLVAYTSEGQKSVYTERWQFLDDSSLKWTLYAETPEGPQEEMGGTYTRKE